MAATLLGRLPQSPGVRDNDGHRTYKLTHKVVAAKTDGPATIMTTPGLPLVGSLWLFGTDIDVWAFCHPDMKVTPVVKDAPDLYWLVEQTFSTRPINRCQDISIENPLLEPQKISGTFVRYTLNPELRLKDKDDEIMQSASFELFRGVEWDASRPTVRISQNVPTLQLPLITSMIDTLNDSLLWGLEARRIKLSEISWERKIFGICGYYYVRTFGFDINFDTFDVTVIEEGTREVIAIDDPDDPYAFKVILDPNDSIGGVFPLQANGRRLVAPYTPVEKTLQFYKESNFLTLGIPTIIGL